MIRWSTVWGLSCLVAACGGATSGLSLSAVDNDPVRLRQALAQAHPAPRPAGVLAVLVAKDELRAVDLAAGRPLWSALAAVRSRVVIGSTVLAALEGTDIVARALVDGRVAWKLPLPPGARLIGLAADGDRVVYAAAGSATGAGFVVASIVLGRETWRLPAPGEIGAPAAAGGLVYLPLQNQWLALLDGEHGTVLARVRRNDLALSGVRAGDGGATYGSRSVLRLADGPDAVPLAAKLPEGVEARWFVDGYNAVQSNYSAFDRTRLLWDLAPGGGFNGPVVALANRALFAYDSLNGSLVWARLVSRAEVVSAEHAGNGIFLATVDGDIDVLDSHSGAMLLQVKTDAHVLGAAFMAGDLRRSDGGLVPTTEDALEAIVRDKDARFGASKRLAMRELGRRDSVAAKTVLVSLVTDETTSVEVAEDAAAALLARPDASAVAPSVAALAAHADRTTGKTGRGVAVLARALGAARAHEAVGPLLDHLEDPATPPAAAGEISAALVQIGDAAAVPRLVSLLLFHRCDPEQTEIADAALDAVFALGGAPERETIAYVADDPRTAPEVAARAREKLGR